MPWGRGDGRRAKIYMQENQGCSLSAHCPTTSSPTSWTRHRRIRSTGSLAVAAFPTNRRIERKVEDAVRARGDCCFGAALRSLGADIQAYRCVPLARVYPSSCESVRDMASASLGLCQDQVDFIAGREWIGPRTRAIASTVVCSQQEPLSLSHTIQKTSAVDISHRRSTDIQRRSTSESRCKRP